MIYANTLYVPPKKFFTDKAWAHITDWAAEMAPLLRPGHPDAGRHQEPTMTPSDEIIKAVADEMGWDTRSR